jgi:hypothetical protein
VSRAGIEPAKRGRTRPTPLHQKHDDGLTPKRRKPPGQTRRLSRKTRKTAYICLKSTRIEAGRSADAASAHHCPTTPVRLRSEQLKYTTAFMTRSECTPRAKFVNENVRAPNTTRRDLRFQEAWAANPRLASQKLSCRPQAKPYDRKPEENAMAKASRRRGGAGPEYRPAIGDASEDKSELDIEVTFSTFLRDEGPRQSEAVRRHLN